MTLYSFITSIQQRNIWPENASKSLYNTARTQNSQVYLLQSNPNNKTFPSSPAVDMPYCRKCKAVSPVSTSLWLTFTILRTNDNNLQKFHAISLKSILVFSHWHQGLPSGLSPSGFPNKTLYVFLFLHSRHIPSPSLSLILFYFASINDFKS